MRRGRRVSSSSSRSSSSCDAQHEPPQDARQIPGRPFLEHLYSTLERQHETSMAQHEQQQQQQQQQQVDQERLWRGAEPPEGVPVASFVTMTPACLFYLQSLFATMLSSTRNAHGVVTQWRKNPRFLDQFDDDLDEEHLGAADPRKILKTAGYLLDLQALSLQRIPWETNLPLPSDCDLSMFPSLQYLRIDGCDLCHVHNLATLKPQLKELRYVNHPLPALSSLLGKYEPEWSASEHGTSAFSPWAKLYALHVSGCALDALDASVALVPALKVLNLRHNKLNRVSQLRGCKSLVALDLAFNHMSSMVGANRTLPSITSLDLSHNRLAGTAGLEKLYSLQVCVCCCVYGIVYGRMFGATRVSLFPVQTLDLSDNAIDSMAEVAYLVSLPLLLSLVLRGNPLAQASPTYRQDILTLLSNEVTLDHVPWTSRDLNEFVERGDDPSSFVAAAESAAAVAALPAAAAAAARVVARQRRDERPGRRERSAGVKERERELRED